MPLGGDVQLESQGGGGAASASIPDRARAFLPANGVSVGKYTESR